MSRSSKNKNLKIKIIIVAVLFFILLVLGGVLFFKFNIKEPQILSEKIELNYGDKFNIYKDLEVSEDVKEREIVKGRINSKELGEQTIVIKVTGKFGMSAEKEIIVEVLDKEAPVIEVIETMDTIYEEEEPLVIKDDIITLKAKEVEFDLKDYLKATDNVDGDLTDAIEISEYFIDKAEDQIITITVKDSSGNEAKKELTLSVVDKIAPVINAEDITVEKGQEVDLTANVTAIDNVDGDITDKMEVSGIINTNEVGQYKVTYKVVDEAGNETVKEITVTVQETFKPMMIYFNDKEVPYENGGMLSGQNIIDSSDKASTWGGTGIFIGDDNKNTHFIGKIPGNFEGINTAKEFIITDSSGKVFKYKTTKSYIVDDEGYGIGEVDYTDRIIGEDGGERVVFQAKVDEDENLIVEATLVK